MKNMAVLIPSASAMNAERIHSGGIPTGTIRRTLSQPNRSVMTMLTRKRAPITKRSSRSFARSRKKPGPVRKPNTSFSTSRSDPKSWVAKSSSTAVPSSPDSPRRRTISPRIWCSSLRYTGTILGELVHHDLGGGPPAQHEAGERDQEEENGDETDQEGEREPGGEEQPPVGAKADAGRPNRAQQPATSSAAAGATGTRPTRHS